MSKNYIIQEMQQFSQIDLLIERDNNYDWYVEKEKGNIQDITLDILLESKNKKYMVVAEPGYGKTRLLKEIIIQSEGKNQAFFIDAKKIKQSSIEEALKKCKKKELLNISEEELQKITAYKNTDANFVNKDTTIICIDALDEVAISNLYDLLESIEEFIDENKDIKIFLSCRTHHLKKVSFDLESLDFKFLTLKPFNGNQIEKFLENKLDKTIDLDSLYKKSKLSNLFDFISTPRYLYYLSELLKEGTVEEVSSLSRAEMFEYFIYRKLNKELQKDIVQSQIDLLKRVLEELALIMKLNGTSEISKDELMTLFKKIDSNFSDIVFRDDLIQKLYDRSLIKDNVDTIEFENQEFLDYLAAKELARFEKVEQVFFDVAIEPHILELYPSWFYALPFVFELQPSIIKLFLNFLDNNKKVFSEDYFQALLSVEPKNVSKELKSKVFDMVFDYHTSHTKWLDAYRGSLSRKLYRYYDETKYKKIKDTIDARKNSGNSLVVLRTNAIRLISLLIKDNRIDKNEIKFWQRKATKWLKCDTKECRYLHRNILEQFDDLSDGDFNWIKKHRFIFETGIQVQAEYARACFKVAPNDTFSIDVYLETDRYWIRNNKDANLSRINDEYDLILQLTTVKAMQYALKRIYDDETYLHKFCKNLNSGVLKNEKLEDFKKNLLGICDDAFLYFLKTITKKSLGRGMHNYQGCNGLRQVLLEVILEKDENYIEEYVDILESNFKIFKWHISHFFSSNISINFILKHFDKFESAILNISDEGMRFNIFKSIYHDSSDDGIKEKIILKYPSLIPSNSSEAPDYDKERKDKACKEWIEKIESEAGKFITDLFEFFVNYKEDLKDCVNYKKNYDHTVKIAKEVLKNNNPLQRGKVEKKENGGATIWQINYYESCIIFAYKENLGLDQEIRDNVFRYLPFNINSDYETTMEVAKEPSLKAIQDIVDVYAGQRDDDLGIYHVRQFVELYNKMKLSQFEPVLLVMLKNESIEEYERVYIAQSLPIGVLTSDIIKENKKELDAESDLYREYLSILIRKYQDKESIDEAFEWTKNKALTMENNDRFYDPMDEVENNIAISMASVDYPIEKDKELLLLSSELSEKGIDNGSKLLKKIVESHLKYLIERKTNVYEIILDIEKFLDANKDKKDLHWFEYTLQDLKQVYLNKVKEPNIVKAIKKYNQLENEDYLPVSSTLELRELIKNIIEQDIRKWIEDEGAYRHIQELAKKEKNINAEDFIQKSIKSQIELALMKRGFRDTDYSIIREEQLLDDKRLDFTVRYGLVGSVMIELKLGHNSEARATTQNGKRYVKKLQKYMAGSNSDYGLFVVFNVKRDKKDKFEKQMISLNKLYENVDEISVMGLDCV